MVVAVPLLLRGRDHATAFVALDQAAQREGMLLRASASPTSVAHGLDAPEQLA